MLAVAHIKQGKGKTLPLNSRHTNWSPALTHTDGRAVGLHMSGIHGKMEKKTQSWNSSTKSPH